ncbi:MAG: DUF4055 domain-containing protein [Devosia sp.]
MADNTPDKLHPEYREHQQDWELMRDTLKGERAIKHSIKSLDYLPKPDGMRTLEESSSEAERKLGVSMYASYKQRAQFPDFVAPAVHEMLGTMHRVEATIELPPQLESLIDNATLDGATLRSFHKRITRELLTVGRFGVYCDWRELNGDVVPYLAGYVAESIINWSEDSTFYVLVENELRRDGFEWDEVRRWRALESDEETGATTVRIFEDFEGEIIEVDSDVAPADRRGRPIDFMPITVATATDITNEPASPPLIGMARAALAIYRLDADYRHQLFWTGQETLVISGIPDAEGDASNLPTAVGSGVMLVLPVDARAEYVSPSGTGIEAHRLAKMDEFDRAREIQALTYETSSSGAESGESRRVRMRQRTVRLVDVALTSAEVLQRSLRSLARWSNLKEDGIVVIPSLDFIDSKLEAQEIDALLRAWQVGGISRQTLYHRLQEGEIARQDVTFEEELADIVEGAVDAPDDEVDEVNYNTEKSSGEESVDVARS